MKIVDGDFLPYRDEAAHIAAGEGPSVDLCDSEGVAWLAPFDWTCVVGTGNDPDNGIGFHAGYVTVIEGAWKGTLYRLHFCHGQANEVSLGQEGSAGDTIGHVGWSGTTIPSGPAGAHLHFWAERWHGSGWARVTDVSGLLASEDTPMDLQRITEALDRVWEVKAMLESKKPLYRPQRDDMAFKLLYAVIAVKEEVGLQ